MSTRTPPRAWSTGDAGSFAHRTLAVRVPQILDGIIAQNPAQSAALTALRAELTHGTLRALADDESGDDKPAWDAACAPFVGRSWLDVPWYFAESYFYRRVLEATGFFRAGAPGFGHDPYLAVKREEERSGVPRARALLDAAPRDAPADEARVASLLLASLWGNRADLSYTAGLAHGDSGAAADLLADDVAAGARALRDAKRVAILLDNAGTELAFDLVLAHALRALLPGEARVVLFAKAHPFFVSDATPADVARTQRALGIGDAFDGAAVVAHPFMTSSGFLRTKEMPRDLVDELGRFDIVIVKGDANYRRLVGDAPWPHDTPFDDAVDFPTRVLALRTLKAEVAVGIPATRAPHDHDWLVSGRYGVVQLSKATSTRG